MIPSPNATTLALLGLSPMLMAVPASAIVLIFEPVEANYDSVDQAYGDRVTQTPQNGFLYGTEGGFTPNIEVGYGPATADLDLYHTPGYGDLIDVLFDNHDTHGHLAVTLTADPAWNVVLDRFDMAAWSAVGPIASVEVRNGEGDILFSEANADIPAIGHRTFSFDPPLVDQVIVVSIDSSNLGSRSDDVCIDNIQFGQIQASVPTESRTWGGVKDHFR